MLLKRIATAAITTVVSINVFTTAPSSMAINSDNASSYNVTISKTSMGSSDGGECGENLDWNYDGIDTITINGSGDMWTIAYSDSAPWHYLKDSVKRVVITEGVQSLSRWAFYNFNSLEQVSFPSTLKTIGVDAFRKCTSLKSISIPDSVTKLDTAVFAYCTALENVRLPNTLTSIPSMAFAGCTNLSSIILPKTIKSIGSTAFTRCKFSAFIVPESVESIDYYAFSGCEELRNIFFENAGEYQIDDDENAIPETAVIHGHKGSESERYATKYGRQFVAIEDEIKFYTYDFQSSLENMKALQDFLLGREHIGPGTPVDYDKDGRIDVFDLCLLKREFYKEAIKLQMILDSDNNGVPDCIENEDYTTDTDKDGLSDYSELMLTATNALLPDTDENGINDYYDDNDIDSISNAEEIALGTDPLLPDSDLDNLSDPDEIKTGTNPLEPDSDKDGAADGWEVANGYDPLVYNVSFDIMSSFEADEITAYVEINGNGSISDSLEVEPVLDNALLNDSIPGYIDTAFSFTTQETFDTATISFDFDSSLLDDASFEPTIYYYDESTQVLEEINTTINGNTASATVTHFSTYILLNKTEFDKVWDIEIREPNESVTSSGMSIIFVLDRSGSMKDNDGAGLRYDLTEEFIDGLDEQDDCVGVITYNDSFDVVSDLTANFTSVKKSLSTIGSDSGGTEGIYAIDQALDMLSNDDSGNERYIIFMTDGEDDTISNSQIVESANTCKTTIYTIGLGDVDDEQLRKIATETKGKYFYSSNADGLISIFEQTKEETVDYHSDSNDDGISDYYTKLISEGELRTGTGTLIADGYSYEELQASDDWDNDSIKNGEEIKITATPGKVTAYFASSPSSNDTDSDGIPDHEDTAPNSKGLADGICGELTIVSCKPDKSGDLGHAWLTYKSYIKDDLDISGLLAGYVYNEETGRFEIGEDVNYHLYPGSYVGIGGAGTEGMLSAILNIGYASTGGIVYNREFYGVIYENVNKYEGVAAYTRTINLDQMNKLMEYCKKHNRWNLYSHNCSTIAVGAWTSAFGISDGFTAKELPIIGGWKSLITTPGSLKTQILSKSNADTDYKTTMYSILKHWKYDETSEIDLLPNLSRSNGSSTGGR